MININDWILQYPSGTEAGGMLSSPFNSDTKYFRYNDSDGTMSFRLNASEKGKSPNGSSVRAELRHKCSWQLTDTVSLKYTFSVSSSNLEEALFTVGQFLQRCDKKDSPLCRIEVGKGQITAIIKNYMADGITMADGQAHEYPLGTIQADTDYSVRLELSGKKLFIFFNGEKCVEHSFPEEVSSVHECYFKLGLYYQNTDSPDIMTELTIHDCDVATTASQP